MASSLLEALCFAELVLRFGLKILRGVGWLKEEVRFWLVQEKVMSFDEFG